MDFVSFLRSRIENPYLLISLSALLPFTEIKGAILLGLSLGLNPLYVYLICFFASSIPVPLILLLLKPVLRFIKNSKAHKIGMWFENHILAKFRELGSGKHIFWKLFSFVAIPAPLTGAYTGSCISALMDLPVVKGMFAVILGNAVAGGIVLGIGMLFSDYADKILFGFILLIPIFLLVSIIKNKIAKRKNTHAPKKVTSP